MQPDGARKVDSAAEKHKFSDYLDLYRLAVFHTVVDEGTMSKASERLFITQPAISAHIKALEREMEVPLFSRVGRGSVVNSAGQVLYEEAERLFTAVDELRSSMEDLRGVAVGRLSLGASLVWQYHLPRTLDLVKEEYPHVDLTTQVANSDHIEKLVVDRSVDIGFIGRASRRTELVSELLTEDEVVPVCGAEHPLAGTSGREPGELEGEAFVVREAGSAVRRATNELLAASGVAVNISMELGSQEAIKQVVMAGKAIGMVSRAALEPELNAGLLAVPGAGYLRSSLHLHVIYHKQKKLTFTQRAFLELIASEGMLVGRRLRLLASGGRQYDQEDAGDG